MQFVLSLFNNPDDLNTFRALNFAQAVLQKKHQLKFIFLQQNAVYLASNNHIRQQHEFSIKQKWQNFLIDNKLTAHVCISAALKRGVIDKFHADKYDLPINIAANFKLTSLGYFLSSIKNSDRLISF